MQSVQLTRLLLSVLVLLILKFKMNEQPKKVLREKVGQRPPVLVVRSSPIDIPKVPREPVSATPFLLESQPKETVPWPAWLTDKYEDDTAPTVEDDLPEEDDGTFVMEDL